MYEFFVSAEAQDLIQQISQGAFIADVNVSLTLIELLVLDPDKRISLD